MCVCVCERAILIFSFQLYQKEEKSEIFFSEKKRKMKFFTSLFEEAQWNSLKW